MLEELKQRVCAANLELVARGLVLLTWGNASAIDRKSGLVVIKPSGVSYDGMEARHMAVVSLENGRLVEGGLKPSSDTATHLALYRAFPSLGGVVHTHSAHATAWSQAECDIPALGTTGADHFHGAIPCTRRMTDDEIEGDYEANTGAVIVERFSGLNAAAVQAVLVANHGPFAWGSTVEKAVENAIVLEYIAGLATETLALNARVGSMSRALLDKHFLRKHGPGAYYGQSGTGGYG